MPPTTSLAAMPRRIIPVLSQPFDSPHEAPTITTATMTTDAAPQVNDLLIVTDATSSMNSYLQALRDVLPDIIRVSSLTRCFSRVGIIAYRDYGGRASAAPVTEWSGWNYMDENDDDGKSITRTGLIDFANTPHGSGGCDWPEAAKTGLALAHSVMRDDATTIMLLFTDAPPHLLAVGGVPCQAEIVKLSDLRIFALVHATDVQASLLYLTAMTNGNYYHLKSATSDLVSDLTMHVLLTWMGLASDQDEHFNDNVTAATYRNTDGLRDALKEGDSSLRRFMDPQAWQHQSSHVNFNLTLSEKAQGHGTTAIVTNPRASPMQALEARYANDAEYRVFVSQQLAAIIDTNASAVATHPVYGSLWRAVCADRANDARDGLVMAKDWLAQSYDFSAVIQDAIGDMTEDERYPCVLFDPTENFTAVATAGGTDNRQVTDFTREELLEIGRSCDPSILRRLGKVLAQMKYVATEADLPTHLRDGPGVDVPRIPLALAKPEHKRSFWKLLLHTVVPGTQLSTRPAALLAALALRMGILPLRAVADQGMIAFSDKWNNLTTTENWNLGCLFLLLDADRDFEVRLGRDDQTPQT
ncbi:putative ariadne-like RING finger protein like [Verticillium longisporum]|nr:putative ariadne-like RING finger protein like [Verticillium longisporum]